MTEKNEPDGREDSLKEGSRTRRTSLGFPLPNTRTLRTKKDYYTY